MSVRAVIATSRTTGVAYPAVQDTKTGKTYPFPEFLVPVAFIAFNVGADDLSRYSPIPDPENYDIQEIAA